MTGTTAVRLDGLWAQVESLGPQLAEVSAFRDISSDEIASFLVGKTVNGVVFLRAALNAYEYMRKFADAVACCRLLVVLEPGDLENVVRLAINLAKSLRPSEADNVLAIVPAHWGSEWSLHYARAMVPYHAMDPVRAKMRLHRFIKGFPDRPEGLGRLAEVEAQLRNWHAASYFADEVMSRFPWVAQSFEPLAKMAKVYTALQDGSSFARVVSDPVQPYVLNLGRSPERLLRMRAWYEQIDVEFERIPATDGAELPSFVSSKLLLRRPVSTNVQGCFLSHISAWERVAAGQRSALILEDDAFPIFRFGDLLDSANIPPHIELCFVNQRMAPVRPGLGIPVDLEFLSLRDEMRYMPATQRGVGLDGYLLTPSGASKLLKFVDKDGIFGHVDWQLLSYCVTADDLCADGVPLPGVFFDTLRWFVEARAADHLLYGARSHPALVTERDFGASTIGHS